MGRIPSLEAHLCRLDVIVAEEFRQSRNIPEGKLPKKCDISAWREIQGQRIEDKREEVSQWLEQRGC